jgi:hypothetical protein
VLFQIERKDFNGAKTVERFYRFSLLLQQFGAVRSQTPQPVGRQKSGACH